MTTRAYNISELGLMRLDDLFYFIDHYSDNIRCMGEYMYSIKDGGSFDLPIKSYAASVVERFAETLPLYDGILWDGCFYDVERKELTFVDLSNSVFICSCPINPFTGLLNPDGTQRTSATREEIEQWRNEG